MLSVLGLIYGKIADIRNALYDKGVFEIFDTRARTISVGNITTGGTGKTPMVAYVARVLADRGEKVCILTRGYGRAEPGKRVLVSDGEAVLADHRTAGDEPYELAQKLLGRAIVIADADRVAAAEWAKRKFGITAFVLDDAFQHRKVKRDLDVVCIDATAPFGGGKMLPAGRLREPLHNLNRADVIVITRTELSNDISRLRTEIYKLNPTASLFESRTNVTRIIPLEEFHAKTQSTQRREKQTVDLGVITNQLKSSSIGAFCALGNPDAFFGSLVIGIEKAGLRLKFKRSFPDHHQYTQRDIQSLEKQARDAGVDTLITTAKDAVRLTDLRFTIPCFVYEVEIELDHPERFNALI